MTKHARLSPSSSARWLTCLASPVMEMGIANTTSEYAAQGTAAHWLAEECLETKDPAAEYLDSVLAVSERGEVIRDPEINTDGYYHFDIDEEMAQYVQEYVDLVISIQFSLPGDLLIEQRLSLENITGERGARGTADAVIIGETELVVVDLKYGQGVQVEAEENTQLMMYGLAALQTYDFTGDIQTVRLVISQPRRHHTSEWTISADDLKRWGNEVRVKAARIRSLTKDSDLTYLFNPSEKACKWCKAAKHCKPYAEFVHGTVMKDFKNLNDPLVAREATMDNELLALMFERVDLIKAWLKTIETAALEKLTQGQSVGTLKLVKGRAGARKWAKEDQVEEILTSLLSGDVIYKKKLISPTDTEKLMKSGDLSKEEWQTLQDLIIKPDGKPTVAPGSDKRKAINPVDIFEDIK